MVFFNKKIEFKSEEDLINSAKKNSRYFAPIYKKYHEQIFRFIYQRLDSIDDASDITSQVFLKALLNLNKFEFKGFPFSSWLYKIALNEVNQYYRKTKKERTVNIDNEKIEIFINEIDEENNEIKLQLLTKILAELNEEKLLLIEMRFFEKRSFKEISEILNITENNAKVKTYRILEEMKKKMF
jgi:RNA polymerase sigma-70 factor (ECF subfamily)